MEKKLSDKEIRELIALHRKTKDKKTAVRINSVILWAKGWKYKDICEALLISESFARNTVERYRLFGVSGLRYEHYEGHNFKMTPEQEEATVKFVENNFVPDSKMVIQWVKERFGIEYTSQGMQAFLKRKGFVYKKPRTIPGKHPSEEVQRAFVEKIKNKMEKCKGKEDEAVYFTDGSGFVHNTKIGYGWIRKGQEKIFKTNTSRRKVNVNGAYNPEIEEAICVEQESPVNQQSNIKLIDKIIEHHREYKKIHIVLDNAKYNHGKIFKAYIEKLKYEKNVEVELIYLPTYSPNLNLIERLWKYAKKKVTGIYYDRFHKFKEAVMNFFENEVKKESCKADLEKFIGSSFQIVKG